MPDEQTQPIALPPSYTLAGASYATTPAGPARCIALFSATQGKNVDIPMALVFAASMALTSQSSGVPWKPGAVLSWAEAVFDAYAKKGVKLNSEFFAQGQIAWAWILQQIPWEQEVKAEEDFSEAPQAG